MNIMAISFSLDWFLTIPGMFISGGVLLLIIALVIFIVTSAKSKKEKINEEDMETPVISEKPITPEMEAVSPVVTESINLDSIQPVASEPISFNPVMEPTELDTVEEPTVLGTPVNDFPVADIIPETLVPIEIPEEEPVVAKIDNPVVEEPAVSIYGGVNPFIGEVTEPTHRQIYGGADPLEATQKMAPIVESWAMPEISPIVPEATITEPVSEPTTPVVMEEPTTYVVDNNFNNEVVNEVPLVNQTNNFDTLKDDEQNIESL
ncbi:MAG: hypothetical protein RSB99_02345 [Bacilli bacterium]